MLQVSIIVKLLGLSRNFLHPYSITIVSMILATSQLSHAEESTKWLQGENICTGKWTYQSNKICSYGEDKSKPITKQTGYQKKKVKTTWVGGPTKTINTFSKTLSCDHTSRFWYCKSFCSDYLVGKKSKDLTYDLISSESTQLDHGVGDCVDWKKIAGRKVSCKRRIFHHKKTCNYKRVQVVPAIHPTKPKLEDDKTKPIYTTIGYEPFYGPDPSCGIENNETRFLQNSDSFLEGSGSDAVIRSTIKCSTLDDTSVESQEDFEEKLQSILAFAKKISDFPKLCDEKIAATRYLRQLIASKYFNYNRKMSDKILITLNTLNTCQ